jgi:tetratricopeptide (TPR) repeat protein
VGKTQLVVEYAYRYATEYTIVWWVHAEELATLTSDYANLATALQLPEQASHDQTLAVTAVRHWLEQHTGWLLILDNAREPIEVHQYLPQGSTGHVLITSLNPNWRSVASQITVPVLERDQAIAFLQQRTGQSDAEAAATLAEVLGDLPLALEQVGAYIESTRTSLTQYLTWFKDRHDELWTEQHPPLAYPHTVATAWNLSMEQIHAESAASSELLTLYAYLAPDDIPQTLIRDEGQYLPEPLATLASDPLMMNKALAVLLRYSLVEVKDTGLSVHRLVQAVVRDQLQENLKKRWAEVAVHLIVNAFPVASDEVRTWSQCARLLPHALAVAGYAQKLEVALDATGQLFNQVGLYLCGRAQFKSARLRLEQALAITRRAHGARHAKVGSLLNNLGTLLEDLGDLEGARNNYEQALTIATETYGPEHVQVARGLNNLGSVLSKLGELTAARRAFERALVIDESTYGPHHPTVGRDSNNLGSVLRQFGELAAAQRYLERALAIDESNYGRRSPEVAGDMNNLGRVLQELGQLESARRSYEEALGIAEEAYGPEHPMVARITNNLGTALEALGKLPEARNYYERARTIDGGVYGLQHPEVARDFNNLGSVLQKLGELAEARRYYKDALQILQKCWGEQHPSTKLVKDNLNSLGHLR